jgi:hypothetical protein
MSSSEQWCDIEACCFVDEELEGSTFTPAQDHSPEPSQDQVHLHNNDRITLSTLNEPMPYTSLTALGEDGRGWSDDNIAQLENGLQLVLKEQEKLWQIRGAQA